MKQLKFSFLPIPEEIMLDETLPFKAKLLFGIIAKTNMEEVKFSVGYLAKRMKCSDRYARQMIQELEKRNLITIKRVKGRASIYSINYVIVNQQQIRSQEAIKQENTPEQKFTPEVIVQDTPEVELQDNNKDISNKEIFSKENIANSGSGTPLNSDFKSTLKGQIINSIIAKFKNVNPSYERLFGNKTQRQAVERLLKKYSQEWLEKLIEALPKINSQPYAPIITTPYELEVKLGKLKVFLEQLKNKKGGLMSV